MLISFLSRRIHPHGFQPTPHAMIGHSPREMFSFQTAWRRFTHPIHMLHNGNLLQRVLWSTSDSNNLQSGSSKSPKKKIWIGCLDRKKTSFCAVRFYEPVNIFLPAHKLAYSFIQPAWAYSLGDLCPVAFKYHLQTNASQIYISRLSLKLCLQLLTYFQRAVK